MLRWMLPITFAMFTAVWGWGCHARKDTYTQPPMPPVELKRGEFKEMSLDGSRATIGMGNIQLVLENALLHIHPGLQGHKIVVIRLPDGSYEIKPLR